MHLTAEHSFYLFYFFQVLFLFYEDSLFLTTLVYMAPLVSEESRWLLPSETFHSQFPQREVVWYATLAYHRSEPWQRTDFTSTCYLFWQAHKIHAFFFFFSKMPHLSFPIFLRLMHPGLQSASMTLTFRRWGVNSKGIEAWLLCCRASFIIQTGLSEKEQFSRRRGAVWGLMVISGVK